MLTTTDAEINHNLCVDDVTPDEGGRYRPAALA